MVHDHGRDFTVNLLLRCIAPLEIGCFIFVILQAPPGIIFYAVVCVYLLFEALKMHWCWKSIIFTRDKPTSYIPFLNNSFYEVWGPLGAALAVACERLALAASPAGIGGAVLGHAFELNGKWLMCSAAV